MVLKYHFEYIVFYKKRTLNLGISAGDVCVCQLGNVSRRDNIPTFYVVNASRSFKNPPTESKVANYSFDHRNDRPCLKHPVTSDKQTWYYSDDVPFGVWAHVLRYTRLWLTSERFHKKENVNHTAHKFKF